MAQEGLFTAFVREERRLSVYLRNLQSVRSLVSHALNATTTDELDAVRGDELRAQLDRIRPEAPTLGPRWMGRISDGQGEWRDVGGGRRIATTRFFARYKVDGDVELLRHWPDDTGATLRAVDDDLLDRIGGYSNLSHAPKEVMSEYWQLRDVWRLGMVDEGGPWALDTYFDLTGEEERELAASGSLADLLKPRVDLVAPIVNAVAEQTNLFFDEVLPSELESMASRRASVLSDRRALIAGVNEGEDWALTHKRSSPVPTGVTVEAITSGVAPVADSTARADHPDEASSIPHEASSAQAATDSKAPAPGGSTPSSATPEVPQPSPTPRKQPHWLVPTIVGAIIALVVGWLGLNDWRISFTHIPFSEDNESSANRSGGGTPPDEETRTDEGGDSPTGAGSTAPVRATKLGNGGVDLEWTIVDDPELHGYSVYVTAVRPVEFEFSVPRYAGDSDVNERIYPARYLNRLLKEAGESRRIRPGQLWHACVQGMRETPLNEPIDNYIIPGTRSCTADFRLP